MADAKALGAFVLSGVGVRVPSSAPRVHAHNWRMALSFELDPVLTDEVREQIVALWVEVTNAGGAVGFVPPVTARDVQPTADASFDGVNAGLDHLLAGFDDGRLVALLFIADNRFNLKAHWRVLKRVMVAPGSQGRGYGKAIMAEAARVGTAMSLTGLHITVRDGQGTDAFYKSLGYSQVGRMPGAIRVAPGDDRDEILMWLPLTGGDRTR
jgi:GNAT superfamily N-acetyltransferase